MPKDRYGRITTVNVTVPLRKLKPAHMQTDAERDRARAQRKPRPTRRR